MSHSSDSECEKVKTTGLDCFVNEEYQGSAGKILYVEDESFVRKVMAEVLRAAGYQVFSAKNAAEAAETFEGRGAEVDLLLTDVVLPGETGRMLAAKLRRVNPELKVLYVTGYAEQMGMRSTASEDCLEKPFSTDAWLDRVRRMLDVSELAGGRECGVMLACAGA